MWERTPADKAYLIVAGEVAIRRNNVEVARLGPGDVVGEMAVVNQKLRTATVVAATPLEVIHFTAEAVTELCERIPALHEVLAATAQERLAPA
jgi:CRP-like cAMP-binding protein